MQYYEIQFTYQKLKSIRKDKPKNWDDYFWNLACRILRKKQLPTEIP